MQHRRLIAPAAFFLFLCWIIYLANTGASSVFFDLVKSLPFGDKLGHFGLYGLLTLLLNLALGCREFRLGRFTVLVGSAVVLLFAVGEELTQFFLPTRTADLTDVIADVVGILLFGRLAVWLYARAGRAEQRA